MLDVVWSCTWAEQSVHTSAHVPHVQKDVLKLYQKGTRKTKRAKNTDKHGQTNNIIML